MTIGKPAPAMTGLFSRFLRRQRYQKVLPYLQGSILDIGCGRACLLDYISPEQVYVGVDRGPHIYQWLLKNRPGREFHQVDLDKEDLDLGQKFDTVVMLAVIEHLAQPGKALRQIATHLKPGGRLLITTPSPLGDIIHRFGACFRLFSQRAVEDHETIFTRAALQTLLNECGLSLKRYQRFLLGGNQLFICSIQGPQP
jgi:2-polyprenyl-3-methyl-5-hydroxy-6-metoxy-1,4-benzoquinol methylase